MNEIEHYTPQRDYYSGKQIDENSLRYRLDGSEEVKRLLEDLRGGIIYKKGKRCYNERYRKMNEVGISALQSFLNGIVSKIGHLSRYKNEERIMVQQNASAKAFLKVLSKNMKTWGAVVTITTPKKDYNIDMILHEFGHEFLYIERIEEEEDNIVVSIKMKVRNKETILIMVEEIMLQSRLRSHKGREQELTAPNVLYGEQVTQETPKERNNFFGGLGGGDRV